MTLIDINEFELVKSGFVFVRCSAVVFMMPFFGERTVPTPIKIMTAICLTLTCLPFSNLGAIPEGTYSFIYLVLTEIGLAAILGFGVKALVESVTAAASLVGYQMGFGTAGLLLQDVDGQLDGFSILHRMLLLLIFLALNLHHLFVRALTESFMLIPIGELTTSPLLGTKMISWTAAILGIVLQLTTPVLIALLLTMAALGLVARAVPQMNVFQLSFPISFFVGLMVYIATMTMYPSFLNNIMETFGSILSESLAGMMPSIK